MPPDLQTRPARHDDLGRIIALYRFLSPEDPALSDAEALRIWRDILNASGVTVFLGEVAEQAVTTCTLVIVPNLARNGRPWTVIENVVTHPEFRARGFETTILAAAMRHARAANCYKVVLSTGSKKESTLAFYEKAGFARGSRTAFEQRF
ncbi:MAG: GNAT family N-acetyltransferase [Alphaproteobacteria bacterium]|nr:GNAT family N-acetyltransferase [Alphaproteobacteria bacterium]